jgi:hypothetical protein
MRHKKLFFAILAFIIVITVSGICAAETRILFYETDKVPANYKIEKEYSEFKKVLADEKGYSVSRIDLPLSREALKSHNPDVLVIVELNKPLDAGELAAIFEFVMQDGKGLFIAGGTSSANQITIPFGMTVDTGTLEDESNQIYDSSASKKLVDKTSFVIHTINRQEPILRPVIQGVNQLALFEGNGISLRNDPNIKTVVTGDWDTYSPKSLVFPKGSDPPVAAAALIGNGCVFLLSDADMLDNEGLNSLKYKYDNKRFGTNIIDWLRACVYRPQPDTSVEELRFMLGVLNISVDDMNAANLDLQKSATENEAKITELNGQISTMSDYIAALESSRDPFLHIEYSTLALSLLGIGVLVIAIVMASKLKKPKAKGEDISDFGYEFEEGEEGFDTGTEGFENLMDAEKAKKE